MEVLAAAVAAAAVAVALSTATVGLRLRPQPQLARVLVSFRPSEHSPLPEGLPPRISLAAGVATTAYPLRL